MAQLNDLLVTGASRLLNGLGILGSTNADSILPNTTDTYSLGSSSKRWNVLYAKTSNIDTETVGTLTVTNYATIGANQAATGTGTGALRVSGGISATQNSWFGGNITTTKNISATGSGSFGGTLSAATTVNINGDWESDFGLYLQEGSSNGQYGAYFLYGVNDTLKIGTMNNNDKVTAITIGRGSSNVSIAGTVTAPTFSGALSGNATTATTLKTARTLTIGNTGKSFNGSANVSWTIAEIGAVNKTGDTMTGMLTINKTQTAAVFGGSVSNISSGAYNPTAGIQICAAAGGATNSTAIGFHNPGISSASIGYYNTDANTGQFKFLSDDATWSVNIGTTVTASLFSGQAEGHRIGYRHLDAGNPNSWNDSRLYIGYGSMYPTRSIGFYNTNSANTGNTLWAEVNDNGFYACTRFGVNGQSTNYHFYVNGSSYLSGTLSLASTTSIVFYGNGTGTYNQSAIYVNSTSFTIETPRATDSGSATILPFLVKTRGGQDAPLRAGKINAGDKVELWTDSEGGNIRLTSPNGSLWSIDALGNTSMRFIWAETSIPFSFSNDGTITGNYFTGTAAYANSTAHYGNNALRSQRDFADGTLITTDLDGGTTNSSIPFLLEIKGNGYSTNTPLFVQAQGYVYMLGNGYSSYINVGGQAIGTFASYIYAFKDSNGKLAFWFPRVSYWQGFDVFCWNCSEGINTRNLINHVTSVSNSALPNSRSYTTTINLVHIWRSGDAVTGAVWNDYAECRESDIQEPGYVLIEKGDDTLTKSTERMQPFAGVSSDTWGFSQGETEKAKTHIAVAGRVLVYPYRPREEYKSGDCVCAAPNGTVDIMTPNEVALHPDRIVGTVSCVPNYETWGGGELADRDPVQVNGRIWIKVR